MRDRELHDFLGLERESARARRGIERTVAELRDQHEQRRPVPGRDGGERRHQRVEQRRRLGFADRTPGLHLEQRDRPLRALWDVRGRHVSDPTPNRAVRSQAKESNVRR